MGKVGKIAVGITAVVVGGLCVAMQSVGSDISATFKEGNADLYESCKSWNQLNAELGDEDGIRDCDQYIQ